MCMAMRQFTKAAEAASCAPRTRRTRPSPTRARRCGQGRDPPRRGRAEGRPGPPRRRPSSRRARTTCARQSCSSRWDMLAEAAGAYEAGDSPAAAGAVYIRARPQGPGRGQLRARGRARDRREAVRGGRAAPARRWSSTSARARRSRAARPRPARVSASGPSPCSSAWGPRDENYKAATELLAQLFIDMKRPALALESASRRLSRGQPVATANLDLYYWLAVCQEFADDTRRRARDIQEDTGRGPPLQGRPPARRADRVRSAGHRRCHCRLSPRPPGPVPPDARAAPTPPGSLGPARAPRPRPRQPRFVPRQAGPRPPAAPPPSAGRARFLAREEIGNGPARPRPPRRGHELDGKPLALRALPAAARPVPGPLLGRRRRPQGRGAGPPPEPGARPRARRPRAVSATW